MSPFDKVAALPWYKFIIIAALAGLAIFLEPKMAIGFVAGAFTVQAVREKQEVIG